MDMMGTERVCYVYCNFCNTTLAKQHLSFQDPSSKELGSSSSRCNKLSAAFDPVDHDPQPRIPPIRREPFEPEVEDKKDSD
ncbi:hypothetical protein Ahy_B08g093814 isoform B [Arachis hypogaea]|uniref:Uncharacterized protein n=1 Tax=Arachis hypogaea TaxID=3818 RepID=A0A444Y6Z8_ARAHY|nr:hypothetical protein Ahy_B08g093814 isoform A [Arachis hypogaea]RYQ97732.1 hypothetical protein Ahy_B08g093814 isoform B [Arachis hypogaea]